MGKLIILLFFLKKKLIFLNKINHMRRTEMYKRKWTKKKKQKNKINKINFSVFFLSFIHFTFNM